jgi:hypothetical protein
MTVLEHSELQTRITKMPQTFSLELGYTNLKIMKFENYLIFGYLEMVMVGVVVWSGLVVLKGGVICWLTNSFLTCCLLSKKFNELN